MRTGLFVLAATAATLGAAAIGSPASAAGQYDRGYYGGYHDYGRWDRHDRWDRDDRWRREHWRREREREWRWHHRHGYRDYGYGYGYGNYYGW